MVNQWKLNTILNTCRKNPKEMVRKLMKLILGIEVLKNSSPTGKNNRTPIPENIYEAVESKFIMAATYLYFDVSYKK